MNMRNILITSLVLLGAAVASSADDSKWRPYIGAETGVDFVQTLNLAGGNETVDLSFKPALSVGAGGGFERGALTLGVEFRMAQSGFDMGTTYRDGEFTETFKAISDGRLRQLAVDPTIGYRLFSTGKLTVHGQISCGLLRWELRNLGEEDITISANTWHVRPAIQLQYRLSERSVLGLRYAFSVSGNKSLSVFDEELGEVRVDVGAIKSHSISVSYSYHL